MRETALTGIIRRFGFRMYFILDLLWREVSGGEGRGLTGEAGRRVTRSQTAKLFGFNESNGIQDPERREEKRAE